MMLSWETSPHTYAGKLVPKNVANGTVTCHCGRTSKPEDPIAFWEYAGQWFGHTPCCESQAVIHPAGER